MKSKTCPKCNETSHSSSDKDKYGKWICPYCGADITHVEVNKPVKENDK